MRNLQIIFSILICLFSSNFVFSQENKAVKYDEFSSLPYEKSDPLTDRANRFAKQLQKEAKTSRAVIIFYNPRKGAFPLEKGKDWAKYANGVAVNGYDIPQQQIISIDGGYREYATLEFWIVPENAELPKPIPTFDKTEVAVCPEIRVAGDGFRHDRKTPLKFSAAIRNQEPNSKFQLQWSVSAGKIIDGQGTNQIEVDLSETNAKHVAASVQVSGLNPECDNQAFASTEIGLFPYKVDEFGIIYPSDLAARFDAFMSYPNLDPTMTGYAIFYGPREGSSRIVAKIVYEIKKVMAFRNFDASRVNFIDGGYREEAMTELYLSPQGAEPPKPTPTVDAKFVVFTDKIQQKKSRKRK